MTQSIAALPPSAHIRDPDTDPRVKENEHGAHEPAKFWSSDEGASFGEVLDAVNPLHHIPVVSSIYRAVSGDEIGLGPRLIGAAIFGGPLGVILAGMSALFEEASGGNVAEHAIALFEDPKDGDERAPAKVYASLIDHAEGDAGEGTQLSAAAPFDVAELANSPTAPSPITEKSSASMTGFPLIFVPCLEWRSRILATPSVISIRQCSRLTELWARTMPFWVERPIVMESSSSRRLPMP